MRISIITVVLTQQCLMSDTTPVERVISQSELNNCISCDDCVNMCLCLNTCRCLCECARVYVCVGDRKKKSNLPGCCL